mmetsp:Transcript_7986/g.10148  ORF Transcript_7986/g.10148 Transcript_7986/m.10148 type:complete len:504 (-) Transcript_7986:102-1613(-)
MSAIFYFIYPFLCLSMHFCACLSFQQHTCLGRISTGTFRSISSNARPQQISLQKHRLIPSQHNAIKSRVVKKRVLYSLQQQEQQEQQKDTKAASSITATTVDIAETTKSYLEFIDPKTNATIVLVGCLHGSSSSAKDVQSMLCGDKSSYTDAVVLELCPPRFKDLQKYRMKKQEMEEQQEQQKLNGNDFLSMVSNKIETRGLATGIAAAILGGVSILSTAMSGFEAGLEFSTAIDYVQSISSRSSENIKSQDKSTQDEKEKKQQRHQNNSCDIILADQLVDETLKRVGSLPSESIQMFQSFCQKGWKNTYNKEATILSDAILGDETLLKNGLQLNIGNVLVRNKEVISELLRLTIPSLIVLEILTSLIFTFDPWMLLLKSPLILPGSSENIDAGTALIDLSSTMTENDWMQLGSEFIMEILTSGLLLLSGYITIALPAAKLILGERDDKLANGISVACKVASEKYKSDDGEDAASTKNARVVAVLGLLHVNGVAKKLLTDYSD